MWTKSKFNSIIKSKVDSIDLDLLSYINYVNPELLNNSKSYNMKLGAFSISLSVKDLATSKAFYEKLGFLHFGGSMDKNYLIMKNEHALIGLFQGMFEGNLLTFNPGWDTSAQPVDTFDDVRSIQTSLKESGITPMSEPDPESQGPGSMMVMDPDGNVILIDQHV